MQSYVAFLYSLVIDAHPLEPWVKITTSSSHQRISYLCTYVSFFPFHAVRKRSSVLLMEPRLERKK